MYPNKHSKEWYGTEVRRCDPLLRGGRDGLCCTASILELAWNGAESPGTLLHVGAMLAWLHGGRLQFYVRDALPWKMWNVPFRTAEPEPEPEPLRGGSFD